ncbi:2OG-Fe(II) oxygenase [Aspergillus candidus]|uniref:Prolyl 4-hydroxylase alpha subunit Fe(2+) 2OG dioxygenase domain-containing protein n=1 Tax=Aspergillus candidus TaxID=41067 RepID=A0A2I2F8B7_ASPCN|nr:hypothetical protein BDW47DRAFT_132480 [Aspergillus candidus]PLB36863.1 hypothetical protein BDW47DRAFT_132480 [Aspergillus candidus]
MDTESKRAHQAKQIETIHSYVTRWMIKECKVDACVDCFLRRLSEIRKPVPGFHGPDLLDFNSFEGEEAHKLEMIVQELRTNFNNLLIHYPEHEGSLLANERVLRHLKGRLNFLLQHMSMLSRDTPPEKKDKEFIQAMQDVLLSSRIRQLEDYLQTDQPESSALQEGSLEETCRQLRDSFQGEAASASFVCGGEIPLGTATSLSAPPPVQLVWWAGEQPAGDRRLILPLDDATPESSLERLRHLVADCEPASFGRGQEDVLDPAYRNAGKLDPTQFLTNFHPADFGIIESVEKILLPNVGTNIKDLVHCRKLTWELYKLNVYSGPSGIFQKHVDTPRAENQIASLVVCLPSPFKGGQLSVRHNNREVEFDWSSRSSSSIQWAAFYTDCEHEIKQITEGERITLTYNIYATDASGDSNVSPNNNAINPETLAPYRFLRNLIQQPSFMKEGGVIGFYSSHAYPHASEVAKTQLPSALKGSDIILYSIFKSLGMNVDVLPILDVDPIHESHYYDALIDTEYQDVARQWKVLFVSRRVKGMDHLADYARACGYPLCKGDPYATVREIIGTERHAYRATDLSQEYGMTMEEVMSDWSSSYVAGVTWINEPAHREMALSYIAYGNEASIDTMYSSAAILVIIPPYEERQALLSERT